MNKLTHADFFAGIGGFALGARWAGIETVYWCENNTFKQNILKNNFPNAKYETDITSAVGAPATIYTAGFSCQDASIANPKGKGIKGERTGLIYPFFKIVCRNRPNYVVLENSTMLISRGDILEILRELHKIGYDAEWQVISKHFLGFPDERKRLILVAYDNSIRRISPNALFNSAAVEASRKKITKSGILEHELSRTSAIFAWEETISDFCYNTEWIPSQLDADIIASCGDAICSQLAQFCFELIKKHYEENIS